MYCKKCGEHISDDAKFCKGCGESVMTDENKDTDEETEDAVTESSKEPRKKRRVWIWVLVVIIVVFIFVGLSQSQNSITLYPIQCTDWATNLPTEPGFVNCNHSEALERQVFTVDSAKGQVMETSPDVTDVTQLKNCTIQDNQHWSCGDGSFFKMPGGILTATQISRSGDNFSEHGLRDVIFVTEDQWNSINGGRSSICGMKWCDSQ